MIQIRFHGRGGHGVKTASRILGTAAFLHGYEAQDFPLYGAERRGAPIVAYTSISDRPIMIRGPIAVPDCVIVADETLLVSAPGGPLSGADHETVVLVNTEASPEALRKRLPIPGGLITMDLSGQAVQSLGSARALSGALGGAACRLVATIEPELMRQAVREELESLGLPQPLIERNIRLASSCFSDMPAPVWDHTITDQDRNRKNRVITLPAHPASISAPSIRAQGNAALRQTGQWRFSQPEIDRERCTRCGICVLRCPDGVMALDAAGYPIIDYDHCKGCLICLEECPLHAIEETRETRSA
jgi:pyruvate ferredoxin oxidoreductase gamma subunit